MAFGQCIRFPAIHLGSVGSLYASSEFTWTAATTPTNTSVTVKTALDGETFSTATSGNEIPGLSLNDNLTGVYLTIVVELATTDGVSTPSIDLSSFSIEIEANEAALPGGDDFYNEGHLLWTSGNNNGRATEIKDWTESSRTVKLYLKAPRAVQVGDTCEILPGCNKTRAICISKFANAVNFRGEDLTPGNDLLMSIPDAQGAAGAGQVPDDPVDPV